MLDRSTLEYLKPTDARRVQLGLVTTTTVPHIVSGTSSHVEFGNNQGEILDPVRTTQPDFCMLGPPDRGVWKGGFPTELKDGGQTTGKSVQR